MLAIYLMISIIFAMMFLFFFNPLTLGLILIFQTISLSLFMGLMSESFWFFYILMLVFIGGMLVLFIYVTSIFPNEKFDFKQNNMISLFMVMFTLTFMLFFYSIFFKMNLPLNSLNMNLIPSNNMFLISSLKMLTSHTSMLLIFMVNYLFYCMIVVIKITNFFKGPLRFMK